jgi:hypothetical protein
MNKLIVRYKDITFLFYYQIFFQLFFENLFESFFFQSFPLYRTNVQQLFILNKFILDITVIFLIFFCQTKLDQNLGWDMQEREFWEKTKGGNYPTLLPNTNYDYEMCNLYYKVYETYFNLSSSLSIK